MVVRTENCSFCEYKIYPGHGIRYVAKDGKMCLYINHKSLAFDLKKTRSHKIRWTVAWRRRNKKLKDTTQTKKRRRKRHKL